MPTRRHLLVAAGAGLTGLATGCDTAPGERTRGRDQLLWWDHFQPREKFQRKLFDRFARRRDGVPVDYTVYNPDRQGQALQLARSSKQLPDVFTLAGLEAPPANLVREGWFAPLELDSAARRTLPADGLLEGLTVFDGVVYSFPVNSPRFHEALVWYNRDHIGRADLDPEDPAASYDEWRDAARRVRRAAGSGVHGWILPLGFPGRTKVQVEALAHGAGATTIEGRDIRTGEYVYHTEPYQRAVEFILSLRRDRTLFPASKSLDARQGRARWAAGASGMFLDGCYCVGVVSASFPPFVEKLGVAPLPVPERDTRTEVYQQPHDGTFWISATSRHVRQASELVSWFADDEHQRDIATAMAAPPYVRSAIDRARVHPTYRRAVESFDEQVFVAPVPALKNPATAAVEAEMTEVKPGLGEIVQGVVTGDVGDYRQALRKLSDTLSAERERAIAAVRRAGTSVDLDDFAFPDWKPGRDTTTGNGG